jgi:asparagine synthase (glutamine-hydrolysing)
MCGITGFLGQADYTAELKKSLALLHHRGPDGSRDFIISPKPGQYLGLGHTRLRIMDTSIHADQPFFSSDQDSVMVFNGEVYNFQVLKMFLPDHSWVTDSDSEVVIELLNHYGISILKHFNGMFAIAWYKKSTGEFVLIRDPLGIKPLYFHAAGAEVIFASEITALEAYGVKPKICRADLLEFLNFGYVHEPNTGFSNISKVAPGQCLIWSNNVLRKAEFGAFEGPPLIPHDPNRLIFNAIQGQKASDVPVGAFFSGGLDSTAVIAALKSSGLYVNSIKNEVENPELIRAKILSKELGVTLDVIDLVEDLSVEQFCKDVDLVAAKVEEPISDYTFVASQQIARMARQKGFVVMFSGMGGDEFFVGYPRYKLLDRLWLYRWVAHAGNLGLKLPFLKVLLGRSKKVERLISYFEEQDFVWAYARVVGYLNRSEVKSFFKDDADFRANLEIVSGRLTAIINQKPVQNVLDKALALDQKGFLAHNLTVTDKSSMQESVEVRVPLLDLSIYSGWVRSPKQRGKFPRVGKNVLCSFVEAMFGRKINFGRKQGFNPPLDGVISKFDKDTLRQMILTPKFRAYLNPAPLDGILDDHFRGKINNTYKIWQLIFTARWLERWATDE